MLIVNKIALRDFLEGSLGEKCHSACWGNYHAFVVGSEAGNVTTCRVKPGYHSLGHARHVEFRSCHARHETMAGIIPQYTQGMKTWMLYARHVKVGFHPLCCSLGCLVLSQTGRSYVCYNCTSAYWSVPQTTSYGKRLQDTPAQPLHVSVSFEERGI